MTHGTRYAYRKAGCRCPECSDWNRNRNRQQRARNPATTAARNARYLSRVNAASRDGATRHGQPWTGADLEVAARDDLTPGQVAAELGRTWIAVANLRQAVRNARE